MPLRDDSKTLAMDCIAKDLPAVRSGNKVAGMAIACTVTVDMVTAAVVAAVVVGSAENR